MSKSPDEQRRRQHERVASRYRPRGPSGPTRLIESCRGRFGPQKDGIGRGRDGSSGDIETNAPGRGEGPGGHLGDQEAMKAVERYWRRQNIVEGDGYDEN